MRYYCNHGDHEPPPAAAADETPIDLEISQTNFTDQSTAIVIVIIVFI